MWLLGVATAKRRSSQVAATDVDRVTGAGATSRAAGIRNSGGLAYRIPLRAIRRLHTPKDCSGRNHASAKVRFLALCARPKGRP
jgi:hypothetical protein